MTPPRRYLGTWKLPSGNSVQVHLSPGGIACAWDTPPSPSWPSDDREHWQAVTFPAILSAIARASGQPVLGVRL